MTSERSTSPWAKNMQCSKCGTENLDSDKFCKSCGTSLAAPVANAATSTVVCSCPACQHESLPSAKFCANCGTKMNTATVAPVSVAEKVVAADAMPKVVPAIAPGLAPTFPPDSVSSSPSYPQEDEMADQFVPARLGSGIKIAIAAASVVLLASSAWWTFKQKTELLHIERDWTPAVAQIEDAVTPLSNAPAAALVPERAPAIAPSTLPKSGSSSASLTSDEHSIVLEQKNAQLNAKEAKAKQAKFQAKKEAREQARIKKAELVRAEHQARAQTQADAQWSDSTTPVARPASTTPATRPASLINQIAACKKQPLFEKEKCMWNLCHDRWGRDGCPSYN